MVPNSEPVGAEWILGQSGSAYKHGEIISFHPYSWPLASLGFTVKSRMAVFIPKCDINV